eukprot:m.275744 g.275744  ORF g.275744 m.275744 type:complete len:408 (-) comp121107_c0_seq1:190-1413(-)
METMVPGSKLYTVSDRWVHQRNEAKMQRKVLEKKLEVLTLDSRAQNRAKKYFETEEDVIRAAEFQQLKELRDAEQRHIASNTFAAAQQAREEYEMTRSTIEKHRQRNIAKIQAQVSAHRQSVRAAQDAQEKEQRDNLIKFAMTKFQKKASMSSLQDERRTQEQTMRATFTETFSSLRNEKAAQDERHRTTMRAKLTKTIEQRAEAKSILHAKLEKQTHDLRSAVIKERLSRRRSLDQSTQEFHSSTEKRRLESKRSKTEFEAQKGQKLAQAQRQAMLLRSEHGMSIAHEHEAEMQRLQAVRVSKHRTVMARKESKQKFEQLRHGDSATQRQIRAAEILKDKTDFEADQRHRLDKYKLAESALQAKLNTESKLTDHCKRVIRISRKKQNSFHSTFAGRSGPRSLAQTI